MPYYVYILSSDRNGTLYVGMTNDLIRRIHEHKEGLVEGFTQRHNVKNLVHFETYDEPRPTIQREKTIKHWKRDWKIDLIERDNPHWRDLYSDIIT